MKSFTLINLKVKCFVALLFLSTSIFAQQDPEFSMYHLNGMYLNPGYTGSHDVINATVFYRNQWLKVPGSPQTASVAVHSPLKNDHIGLGLTYTYDAIGVTKTNSLYASFAYRIKVGKKKDIHLCFGLNAGFDNYRSDLNTIATTESDDPAFTNNAQKRWLPNFGAGFYAYNNSFFAGISVPRILSNTLKGKSSAFSTSTTTARQYQEMIITGGYVFTLSKKVKFMPSVLVKYVPLHAPVTFDFSTTFIFIDRLWLGASYRFNDSYNFMFAFEAIRQLRIGYCYDLTVSPLNKSTSGTHEIMLSFEGIFKHGKDAVLPPVKYF